MRENQTRDKRIPFSPRVICCAHVDNVSKRHAATTHDGYHSLAYDRITNKGAQEARYEILVRLHLGKLSERIAYLCTTKQRRS